MNKLLTLLVALLFTAAARGQTHIVDSLCNPTDHGTCTLTGTMSVVSQQSGFLAGHPVAKTVRDFSIVAGAIDLYLAPNDSSNVFYTVNFTIAGSNGKQINYSEKWLVPTSSSPVTIQSILIPVAPGVLPYTYSFGGNVNMASATQQKNRQGSSLPATCSVGESFILTSSVPWSEYGCTATNTWTKVAGYVPGSSTQLLFNSSGALAGSSALTFDGSKLVAQKHKISGGTISGTSSTDNFLRIEGAIPSGLTDNANAVALYIDTAGTSAHEQQALAVNLNAGYTGSNGTAAIFADTQVAGTSQNAFGAGAVNLAILGNAEGTGSGDNVGVEGTAKKSSYRNIGIQGQAVVAQNSAALNIGAVGQAALATKNVGGLFLTFRGDPTTVAGSTAILADVGTTGNDLFDGVSNGVQVSSLSAAGLLSVVNLKVSGLSTGIAHVSSTGAVTSSPVLLASEVTGSLPNANLENPSVTVNGTTCTLGSTCTVAGSGSVTALTGDVSATGPGSVSATVNTVGGSTAANVHSAEVAANAAASANTASTVVKRDGSGNFAAGTVTAALAGNATTATALAANPADCSANLYATGIVASGDLTCAQITASQVTPPASDTNILFNDAAAFAGASNLTWNKTTNLQTLTGDFTVTNTGTRGYSLFGAAVTALPLNTTRDSWYFGKTDTTTGNSRGFTLGYEFDGTTTPAGGLKIGLSSQAFVGTVSTANLTGTGAGGFSGGRFQVSHGGSGTVTRASGLTANVTSASSGVITDAAALNSESPSVNSGIWNSYSGLWVNGGTVTGGITTRYGVRVDSLLSTGTKWAFYAATDPSYFGGAVTLANLTTGVAHLDSGGLVTSSSVDLSGSDATGTIAAARMPALTGDVTTSAGAVATTVSKINGTSLAGLATGLYKNTTGTGAPSIAVAGTDYVSRYAWAYVEPSLNLATSFASNFFSLTSRGPHSTTEANVQIPMPVAVTLGNAYVHLTVAPGGSGAALTFTLRSNGVDKALTCTITDPATSCQDTTHTYAAAAGELLSWGVTATGSPSGTSTLAIAVTLQ